jgi:hypothetical protein
MDKEEFQGLLKKYNESNADQSEKAERKIIKFIKPILNKIVAIQEKYNFVWFIDDINLTYFVYLPSDDISLNYVNDNLTEFSIYIFNGSDSPEEFFCDINWFLNFDEKVFESNLAEQKLKTLDLKIEELNQKLNEIKLEKDKTLKLKM